MRGNKFGDVEEYWDDIFSFSDLVKNGEIEYCGLQALVKCNSARHQCGQLKPGSQ